MATKKARHILRGFAIGLATIPTSLATSKNVDYRRKCDAAERAYEAKREKKLAMMQCRELEFLMLDPSSLPPAKRAIIEKKQAEIMRKYPDA
ncbi:hypothetical protein Tco_1301944 [Tanacetum coccineum]